jgi:putative tricarboxylic transport membrane protein
MKKRDRASSLFWMGFGVMFLIGAWRQGLMRQGVPGPGFLPFLCGIALILLSLAVLISALVTEKNENGQGREPEKFFPEQGSRRRMVCTLAALVAYGLCLPYLGFLLTTFVFMLFTLRLMERQKWIRVILLSLSIAVLAHLLFAALDVQMPPGILGIWGEGE